MNIRIGVKLYFKKNSGTNNNFKLILFDKSEKDRERHFSAASLLRSILISESNSPHLVPVRQNILCDSSADK